MFYIYCGNSHYPRGGALDFYAEFASYTLAEIEAKRIQHTCEWLHITDNQMKVLYTVYNTPA